MKGVHLDNGNIVYSFRVRRIGYQVLFVPLPGLTFSITVSKDDRPIDYRIEFWGSANRWTAQHLLDHSLKKLKP